MNIFSIKERKTRLALFLGAVAALSACGSESGGSSSRSAPAPETGAATTRVSALGLTLNSEYPSRSFYTGRVESARSSDLGFELGGTLDSVAVDEGDEVARGDVLATLDVDRLRAQLKEAEAGVAQAKAQSGLARSTLNRLIEAREFDGVSQQQLDEAENAAATSHAAVLAAESRYARVSVDVSKAQLVAPYDAVVLKRHHDEGQVLSPGQPVLSVQDTGNLQVRIGVAGSATNQLETGGVYTLVINAAPVVATLRSVLPVRDAVARTVDAIFDHDRSRGEQDASRPRLFSVGDLAQLELRRTVTAEGYWVPLTALAEGDRGLWNVYVLAEPSVSSAGDASTIESRSVEVLYQDGSRAFINGALKPDERIIPDGLNRVVPGQRVIVATDGL